MVLFGYLLARNLALFGETRTFTFTSAQGKITPGPGDRVAFDGRYFRQTGDLIYFSTLFPVKYDRAVVRIVYRNPNPGQTLSLGFQDTDSRHYAAKLFDSPLINSLPYPRLEDGYTLFQKKPGYSSVEQFLNSPPRHTNVGIFNLDKTVLGQSKVHLSGYAPAAGNTVINVPLRGKTTLYAYVDHEPFKMAIRKQDLNWYQGGDVTAVNIYKDGDLVYTATAPDDGITDGSGRVTPPQSLYLQNPGPGLPEPGVYKIVIDAPGDTVIESIATNLHKLVFDSPVFPVQNSSAYPSLKISDQATVVYTNAGRIKAKTYHSSALQNIAVFDPETGATSSLNLSQLNQDFFATPSASLATAALRKITLPKSDVVLSAQPGYFAFSPDQYFLPTPFQTITIVNPDDLYNVGYVLADYRLPRRTGDWNIATARYDLTTADVLNGRLNWQLKAPELRENGGVVTIDSLEITLTKSPLWRLPKIF